MEAEKHDSEHRLKTFFENEVMSRMLRCLMMSHSVSYGSSESGPIPDSLSALLCCCSRRSREGRSSLKKKNDIRLRRKICEVL